MGTIGVYKIFNKNNDLSYVGSSVNIENRWTTHIRELKKNCHHSSKLQRLVNKYTIDILEFVVLEVCEKDELLTREQYYTKDGTFIKKWESISDCCISLGLDNSSVSKVLKGKLKTTGNFKFKYYE